MDGIDVKISAIVCTHNGSKYIRRALESLIDQSLPKDDYEIIVVDNRSTDSTREIAESLESGAGNLRYVYEQTLGLSHARNRGVDEARGEIIAFLDDDAYAGKEWLKLYVDVFEKITPWPVAAGGRIMLDWEVPRPEWFPESMERSLTFIDYSPEPRFLDFARYEYPFGANMAFLKKELVEFGGFDTNLGRVGKSLLSNEEKELFFKIHEKGLGVYYVPEACVHHAVTRERVSRGFLFKRQYWQGISDVVWYYTHESKAGERGRYVFYLKNLLSHLVRSLLVNANGTKRVELGCRVRYYLGCLAQELKFMFQPQPSGSPKSHTGEIRREHRSEDVMKSDRQLLAYFGHHKCATQYINSIIIMVCKSTGQKFMNFHNPSMFNKDLRKYLEESDVDFLAYINADYQYVSAIDNYRGFHVIRDPRDICVSAYFSHLYSHPTNNWPQLVEIRAKLKGLSKDDGLMLELELRKSQFTQMYNWDYSLSNVMEFKMEKMTAEPDDTFLEIFRFLGLLDARSISITRLLRIVHDNSFSKKAGGRRSGEEDVKSHYRKGVAGDWVNHFTKRHIEYFKEHYNDLLVKLGYESGRDW